ncbi:MAG: hypothetical protein ACXVIG_06090 [Halobacteriota archaeon]
MLKRTVNRYHAYPRLEGSALDDEDVSKTSGVLQILTIQYILRVE